MPTSRTSRARSGAKSALARRDARRGGMKPEILEEALRRAGRCAIRRRAGCVTRPISPLSVSPAGRTAHGGLCEKNSLRRSFLDALLDAVQLALYTDAFLSAAHLHQARRPQRCRAGESRRRRSQARRRAGREHRCAARALRYVKGGLPSRRASRSSRRASRAPCRRPPRSAGERRFAKSCLIVPAQRILPQRTTYGNGGFFCFFVTVSCLVTARGV